MARSVGNMDLAIGLVNCPVKMVGVSESHDRKSSMYHRHDDGSYAKVKMPKTCEGCGAVLSPVDISKGYEENGALVMLSPDEQETVAANTGTSIEVGSFIKADEINPMLFADENIYRLIPDPKRGHQAQTTYKMIRQKLIEKGVAGVVQYVKWGRNRLGLLMVEPTENGGVLVVQNMMWPDELRSADSVLELTDTEIDPRLLPVMDSVIDSMTAAWNPAAYVDAYTEQLNAAIEAKASGEEVEIISPEDSGKIDDVSELLARLEASVAKKAPARKAAPRKRKVA